MEDENVQLISNSNIFHTSTLYLARVGHIGGGIKQILSFPTGGEKGTSLPVSFLNSSNPANSSPADSPYRSTLNHFKFENL